MSDPSVRERLASIEQHLIDNNHKLSTLFELLNPLKDEVAKQGVHIGWIAKLGSIGIGIVGLFSAWLAMR